MANSNLIKGAGTSASSFGDLGGGFNAGLKTGSTLTDMQTRALNSRLYQERQDEVELKNYVNSMDTVDVAKVEESMRPEVNSYLIKSRNEYSEAAKQASTLDAEDPAYAEAIATMNRINTSFKTLSTNLDGFKTKREQYYQDTKDNSISLASNRVKLDALYKNNEFDIIIGPNGGFSIANEGVDGTEFIDIGDFDKDTDYNYFLRNNEGFDEIMKLTDKAQKAGQKIEGGLEENYMYQIKGMFNTMGREDMLSMLYDTVISDEPLNKREDFNPELLNMENDLALRKWLGDTTMSSLKVVAQKSAAQLAIKNRPKETVAQRNARQQKVARMKRYNQLAKAPKLGDMVQGKGGRAIVWSNVDGTLTPQPVFNGQLYTKVILYDNEAVQDWLNN